ncbi:hypothetical protein MA16_Dca025701 [Dendrobium catenatum]|uniref:Uncharacterized protein n=1 Tax=Dendrobium catenatum TaxID=906689 RepID=A0A2I0X054_9ASPA|nr:hypothetical protein MA16_Dca025701 [Dendrobium catenatum]
MAGRGQMRLVVVAGGRRKPAVTGRADGWLLVAAEVAFGGGNVDEFVIDGHVSDRLSSSDVPSFSKGGKARLRRVFLSTNQVPPSSTFFYGDDVITQNRVHLLISQGFDATKERIGSGHNRYFVVPLGGKTTQFRGPWVVITVYPAVPFGGRTAGFVQVQVHKSPALWSSGPCPFEFKTAPYLDRCGAPFSVIQCLWLKNTVLGRSDIFVFTFYSLAQQYFRLGSEQGNIRPVAGSGNVSHELGHLP